MTGAPLQPLLADLGIVPVVVFWLVMVLVARAKKQQKQQQASRPAPAPPAAAPEPRTSNRAPQAEGGLLSELRRAMEELKRAESQTAAPSPVTLVNTQARAKLEQKKQEAARRRAAKQQAQRLPMGAAEDQSSEGVSLENSDYDTEAEQIIATRRQAAERRVREDVSVEDLTDQQKARRASRSDIAIGGEAEHNAWHSEIGGKGEVVVKKRPAPFHRFADGSPKSAVVMSLILGPPPGLRQDG